MSAESKAKGPASTASSEGTFGEAAYAKIFPPIGIARVGDSRDSDGWFIGPDLPEAESRRQPGFTFRDQSGRLKRQAAQFRVYAFSADHRVLGEITADDARIVWEVTLANKKPAWFEFDGTRRALAVHRGNRDVPNARNASVGKLELHNGRWRPNERRAAHLEIHGGKKSICGRSERSRPGDTEGSYAFRGMFKGKVSVDLGELRTDPVGRLLVLGGRGMSDAVDDSGTSIRDKRWIRHYANNDDWYDDVSDGPVTAKVSIAGSELEVRGGAWVMVAPPDFAPDVQNLVTLYDVMEEVAHFNSHLVTPGCIPPRSPEKVAFSNDIAPILRRAHGYRWTTEKGLRGHGAGKPGDLTKQGTEEELRPDLTDRDAPAARLARERVFSIVRRPAYQRGPSDSERYDTAEAKAQATTLFMPPLAGDEGDPEPGVPDTWHSVTYLQYERLGRWSKGDFTVEVDAPSGLDARKQIEHLTRVTLEACAGGAFYPGIEMTCITREPSIYCEAFRLDHGALEAGDVTRYMALPWQADFYECRDHWWPAQRPDDVLPSEEFDVLLQQFQEETRGRFVPAEMVLFNRKRWDRGLGSRPRPSTGYLRTRLLPEPTPDETASEYVERITNLKSADRSFDVMPRLLARETPVVAFAGYATDPWPPGESGERLPNPWRLQYLCQSALDAFSGLYFHALVPSPEDALAGRISAKKPGPCNVKSLDELRREWRIVRINDPAGAAALLGSYAQQVRQSLVTQVQSILSDYERAQFVEKVNATAKQFVDSLRKVNVADLEGEHPEDFDADSDVLKLLRAAEMLQQLTEMLYLRTIRFAGDMGMVDAWKDHGLVVATSRPVRNDDGSPVLDDAGKPRCVAAQVETERARYDGRSFRDYFHYLMNIEDHPDFIPFAKRIAQSFLDDAQRLIDAIGVFDEDHPESFVEYSRASFGAKLEEIYEILRQQAVAAQGWRTSRTRSEWVARMLDTAPFNQTDGAWLRYVANAGPTDKVRAFLFEVWSDEVGNGDPSLHHGNLFTTLLQSMGEHLPPINSRAYADNPRIHEMQFIGAVFQLAISLHSEDFFPELLGMTLFLEWEVLSLVSRIKGIDFIGIDSHFWEMHVGIDNATDGHGAKARAAVELYLDNVAKDAGQEAMQREWKRIWRGFVAFASAGYDYFANAPAGSLDDVTLGRAHPSSPANRVVDLIERKAHYGKLNHRDKQLGGNRLNDLFEEPAMFLAQLANSPWIVPGKPDESRLLNYLTTFDGPMYKVFDAHDLALWREWIEWLGKEGDSDSPKRYVTKAESMLLLLSDLRELARGSAGHQRHRVSDPGAGNRTTRIAEYFERGDLRALMVALAAPDNGWVVPCDPGASPLVVDMARGNNSMGQALDQRRRSLGNQHGRQVVIKWIEAGCPVPGEPPPPRSQLKTPPKWDGSRLLTQQFGMGAVH